MTRSRVSDDGLEQLLEPEPEPLQEVGVLPILTEHPEMVEEVASYVENAILIFTVDADGNSNVFWNELYPDHQAADRLRVQAHKIVGSGEYIPPEERHGLFGRARRTD